MDKIQRQLMDSVVKKLKATFGNPCKRHKNVVAWTAKIKKDNEGLHCFGCFITYREKKAVEMALRKVSNV